MATVYIAVQEALGREVAIKVMKSTSGDTTMEDRFLREGQNLARLNHHNIAAIYNIARSDDYFYFAMELLEGGTLSDHLKQGVSITFAINVILQIGSALEAAHRLGIVHRDLKPSNIIFRDSVTPVLTDFGIAKDTTSDTRLTGTGMMVGTPHYMSPEQIMGRDLDGRSDVYSLGVVFYELLTGKLPFDAEGDQVAFSVAMKHMNEPIPRLPESVAVFQEIIDSVLAKNPDERFPSANAMCYALRQVVVHDEELQGRMGDETMLFSSEEFAGPMFTPSGGFTPGSGTFRPSGRFTPGGGWVAGKTPSGGHPAPGQATQTPGSGQSARVTLQNTLGTKKGKGVTAGIAAAIIAVVAFIFWPDSMDSETRAIVEGFMMKADRQVSARKFVGTGDDNALNSLQAIFSVAPEYKPAMRLVEEITGILEAEALIAVANQNLDDASEKIEQGLRFDPANEGLLAVQDRLELARAEIRRAEDVARLLAQAGAEIEEESLLVSVDTGAAVTLQQVLEIDPGNERALAELDEVTGALLREFRTDMDEDTAEDQLVDRLNLLKDVLGSDERVAGLVSELQGVLELRVNRERARQLVNSARPLLDARSYYSEDPESPSALSLLLEAQELDPDNEDAARGMDQIAAHYSDLAQGALANKEYDLASDHIEIGLLADPSYEALLNQRATLAGALQAKTDQLNTLLAEAQRLIDEGALIAPTDSNALNVLQTLQQQAPDNSQANNLRSRMPGLVSQQINQLIATNEFEQATTLARTAISAFPDREDFVDVPDRISRLQQAFTSGQEVAALTALASDLLASTSLSSIEMQRGVGALREVLSLEPDNAQAVSGLAQFETKGLSAARNLISTDELDSASEYADALTAAFPESRQTGELNNQIQARRDELVRLAEQERIANSRTVLLQALPWGRIESVKRVGGEVESLPEQTVTPVEMLLLPGRYEVAFSHPDFDESVSLSFLVSDSGDNTVMAVFEEVKASDFFSEVRF